MALSKGIIEEVMAYCKQNLTHVPKEVDTNMVELYKKYHKSAFRTIEKGIEVQGMKDKLEECREREMQNFSEFFNYVMEVPNESRS